MINPKQHNPGAAPGVEHDEIIKLQSSSGQVLITCIDYGPKTVVDQAIANLDAFLGSHRPDWAAVRWINITGLTDMGVIHALATKYDLHPLAIEDVLHLAQRPKTETYGGEESELQARLFIVTHVLQMNGNELKSSQVSLFLGHRTVLTFQEAPSDVWNPIIQRIKSNGARLRKSDASFLMYSLLDAIVDRCFPILEHYGDREEELETIILENPTKSAINEIHQMKRDLLLLRRVIWPMREVVANLQRETHECVSDLTRVYLRDLYDHVIQIIDMVEIYRESVNDLAETYMTAISNRMNEVMKVLTIIGTVFIPLTFLAGVYGMNFHYLPELEQRWAYPVFWVVCVLVAVIMFVVFRRRNWL